MPRISSHFLLIILAVTCFAISIVAVQAIAKSTHGQNHKIGTRPQIKQQPLPNPPSRLLAIRKRNRDFYGYNGSALLPVKTIVEHYTAGSRLSDAIGYWIGLIGIGRNICTHFVIDSDGAIIQTTPLSMSCSHARGVDPWSIGIEHVGRSDQEVTTNANEMGSSYRLTCWLRRRYHINTRYVIGHSEVTSSPFYKMLDPAERGHTSSDMSPTTMNAYRTELKRRCG